MPKKDAHDHGHEHHHRETKGDEAKIHREGTTHTEGAKITEGHHEGTTQPQGRREGQADILPTEEPPPPPPDDMVPPEPGKTSGKTSSVEEPSPATKPAKQSVRTLHSLRFVAVIPPHILFESQETGERFQILDADLDVIRSQRA